MLIIFDVDGTLLDTLRVTVPAVQRTFAAHGLPEPPTDIICSFFGRPVADYHAWLASLCPPGQAAAIISETDRVELDLIGSEGRLYDGILETLNELRNDGHRLAICSNGPEDYVDEFVDAHRLRGCFDFVITRGTKYDGKTVMVREILDRVPARPAFVIGDRHDDVAAAHANGIQAIGVAYGFGNPAELRDADAVIRSPNEILPVLKALSATP